MQVIFVPPNIRKEIVEDLSLGNPKKISAIKKLRAHAHIEGHLDLRTAKNAIERLQDELGMVNYPHARAEGPAILSGPRIKKIVVDFGEGDLEVDIEQMQLNILSQLSSIGLEACGHILELVQAIKAFSDGHRIGILKEEE